jgi:hypothetical protein
MSLMKTSTEPLSNTIATLTKQARALGLSDTEWATRAGVRKETLSRLRHRRSCDFETLRLLAEAVGARLGVVEVHAPDSTPDGHFPAGLDRDRWAGMGPRFFMAGLAVMLASGMYGDRRRLLDLAERLHPGASEVAVFNRWLERSPLRPTRFLPLVDAARQIHAA